MTRAIVTLLLSACVTYDPPPPGEHLPGYVSIQQSVAPDETWIGAAFEDGRDQCPATTTTEVDGCTISRCDRIDSLASSFDAGLLTIAGRSIRTLPPRQRSQTQIDYGSHTMSHDFVDGETLTISTAGATVPAFSTTLSMPAVATIVRPTSLVLDRTQPLAVTWTGGGGEVVIIFWGPASIQCRFPASTGSATVPAEVLAMLPLGAAYLGFVTRIEVSLAVAPWDVRVSAFANAAWPDGSAANNLLVMVQ